MPDNVNDKLFDLVKQQDVIMHNTSAELGVKTSLYLVFTAFVITASIQIINFSKDNHTCLARHSVFWGAIGAGISILAGFMLIFAAAIRDYSVFPAASMVEWLKKMDEFHTKYPDKPADFIGGLLETLVQTVDENQAVNNRKARWIQVGMWLLFASLPFIALSGFLAIRAYLNLPS